MKSDCSINLRHDNPVVSMDIRPRSFPREKAELTYFHTDLTYLPQTRKSQHWVWKGFRVIRELTGI